MVRGLPAQTRSQLCLARGLNPRGLPPSDFRYSNAQMKIQLVREALHRKSALPLWPLEKSSIDSDGSAAALFLWRFQSEKGRISGQNRKIEAILLTSRIRAT